MSQLREAVAEIVIAKAKELVEPMADKYEPAEFAYQVASGMRKDNQELLGDHLEYCEKCIALGVATARQKYLDDRRELMGKIYEVQKTGVITGLNFKRNKDGNVTGNNLTYERIPEFYTKEEAVKELEKQLNKKYSIRRIFSEDYFRCDNTHKEHFEHCENCGITFHYMLSLESSDELDYYEELSHEELVEKTKDPQSAYEFMQILDYWDSALTERIGAIAAKLIKP